MNVPLCMVKHWKLWIIEPEGQVKWIFSCPSGSLCGDVFHASSFYLKRAENTEWKLSKKKAATH